MPATPFQLFKLIPPPPPLPSFFRYFATSCVPCLAASRLLSWRAQTRATEHTHSPSTESFCGPCLRLAWPAFLLGRLMLHISTIISWPRRCRMTAQGVFVLYLCYCCLYWPVDHARHTPPATPHTSHVTCHTSRITRDTSLPTRHASRVSRHTSPAVTTLHLLPRIACAPFSSRSSASKYSCSAHPSSSCCSACSTFFQAGTPM